MGKFFENINTRWFEISDKIRFILVGCFNAGVSYLVFSIICLVFGIKYYQISLALSWILSSFVSFTTQRFFVFNVRDNIIKQYCKCCITWTISYVINAIILEIFVKKLVLNVYIAQILATLFCAIFTYILFKTFAFRRKT